jgi:hypothetical protein
VRSVLGRPIVGGGFRDKPQDAPVIDHETSS